MFIIGMVMMGILWAMLVVGYKNEVNNRFSYPSWIVVPFMLLIMGACVFITMGVTKIEIKNSYENSLKGNNPYEMVIRYELKDSLIYPVDTIFILK